MENRKNIIESIDCYTSDSQDCEIMKVLMSPIEHLGQLGKAFKFKGNNKANDNLCNFLSKITNDDMIKIEFDNNVIADDLPKNFIKTSTDLYKYLKHIQNILLQAYINYHETDIDIPKIIYRSVTKPELEYLKQTRSIDTLWSTTNTLDSVTNYTLEIAEYEWNPKEHFIIKLNVQNKIPFINVDKDAHAREPNEFILIPPFEVSKLKLIKTGGMNVLGFYELNSIPMYSANIKTNYDYSTVNQVPYDSIIDQFDKIKNDINLYGNMIENYLNNIDTINLLHNERYRNWAKNLLELTRIIQIYINEYAKESIKLNNEQPKTKILK